jgi:hypothetical protein
VVALVVLPAVAGPLSLRGFQVQFRFPLVAAPFSVAPVYGAPAVPGRSSWFAV